MFLPFYSFSIISIGGGIHGVSTAYYLSQRGVKSLIIEKSSIAAAASGNDNIVDDADYDKACYNLDHDYNVGVDVDLENKSYLFIV